MAIYQFEDKVPKIDPTAWISPEATVIGDVTVGAHASVWPAAVLRGDMDSITVGENTNIQDGCVVHTDAGAPVRIGRNVTVGHLALLHGCTVGDGCLIGMGAVLLSWSSVGENALVGAGSLVSQHKTVSPGTLVLGRPARRVRTMDDQEIAAMHRGAPHYADYATRMAKGLKKLA